MTNKYIWMVVTQDKYELPVYVADTAREIAEIVGTTANSIISTYSHYIRGNIKNCKYRRVEA